MKRVMVVDDEKPVVDGITLMIERELGRDFVVVASASSGREALERVDEVSPDIILMDVSMPGISGLDTIRELRKRGSNAVCVLVTAYERFDIAREAVELGLIDYLLKPVTRDSLSASLRVAGTAVDRRRDSEQKLVDTREREKGLLPFAESALIQGLMLGDGNPARREAALRSLGVTESFGLVFALSYGGFAPGPEGDREVETLHARLLAGLRYHSRAIVGPPVSRTALILLPCREGGNCEAVAAEVVDGIAKALGPDFGGERPRLGRGGLRPMVAIAESSFEALASLSSATERDYRGSDIDFEADEEFLHAIFDRDESAASRILHGMIEGSIADGRVTAAAAGRLAALFGGVYRMLDRRGFLRGEEINQLMDIRDLALGGEAGPWRLAALARFAHIREILGRGERHSPQVDKALAYIRANFQRAIGLELAAEWVGLSPNRLSRLLVEETGRGFSELLIDCRIEHAKALLKEPGATIKEVSLASGYTDPNYFARLFKKVTGRSPSNWADRVEDRDV